MKLGFTYELAAELDENCCRIQLIVCTGVLDSACSLGIARPDSCANALLVDDAARTSTGTTTYIRIKIIIVHWVYALLFDHECRSVYSGIASCGIVGIHGCFVNPYVWYTPRP